MSYQIIYNKEIERLRRYQIILPEFKDDGSAFPPSFLKQTIAELFKEFGGVTTETGSIVRLTCDVPDTQKNTYFFICFKETCRLRFEQKEIWLTSFLVDRIL